MNNKCPSDRIQKSFKRRKTTKKELIKKPNLRENIKKPQIKTTIILSKDMTKQNSYSW